MIGSASAFSPPKSPNFDTAGEILLNVYFNEVCLEIELRHRAITPP
jgi:hypothetical protein